MVVDDAGLQGLRQTFPGRSFGFAGRKCSQGEINGLFAARSNYQGVDKQNAPYLLPIESTELLLVTRQQLRGAAFEHKEGRAR